MKEKDLPIEQAFGSNWKLLVEDFNDVGNNHVRKANALTCSS